MKKVVFIKVQKGTANHEISGCHKIAKWDSEKKVKEMAKNKVKGSPKTRAKRGKEGKKARAH